MNGYTNYTKRGGEPPLFRRDKWFYGVGGVGGMVP